MDQLPTPPHLNCPPLSPVVEMSGERGWAAAVLYNISQAVQAFTQVTRGEHLTKLNHVSTWALGSGGGKERD